MWLKVIIIGLLLFGVYKLFGGKLLPGKASGKPSQKDVQNMVECDMCGAYVSDKDVIIFSGKHYCSLECKNNSKV